MKKNVILIFLFFIEVHSFGQSMWGIDFETPGYLDRISIDTISNPNCIWQIGQPNKSVFTSAFSIPNAILTDSVNPVPPNDTSIFYLIHERDNLMPYHIFRLLFKYQFDGDSTDFGTIEISPDNGLNWINMLTQDTTYQLNWINPKPTLTGSTIGWQEFIVSMDAWASGNPGWGPPFPIAMSADTIRFRFTYITDNNSTPHDGWMIDEIRLEDVLSGIQETKNDNLISIYPNPTNSIVTLNDFEKGSQIEVFNIIGEKMFSIQLSDTQKKIELDLSNLSNGIYFVKISNGGKEVIKKLIKN